MCVRSMLFVCVDEVCGLMICVVRLLVLWLFCVPPRFYASCVCCFVACAVVSCVCVVIV